MATRTRARRTAAGQPQRRAPEALTEYEAKRDFAVTNEPAPGQQGAAPAAEGALSFVVHKHDATRLHYDLRLEIDGALASWSVPRGPSYDPAVRRLAVQTEDHPLEYGKFEGRIPDGEYGAGDSLLWDRGAWETVPPGQGAAMRRKGHLHFRLSGEKLRGEWHLIRTTGPRGERGAMGDGAPQGTKSQWLLFKAKDGAENAQYDVIAARPESVLSGRVVTRGPERQKGLRAPRPPPGKLLEGVLPPMLATLVAASPAAESDYAGELKIDGYRALCALSSGRVELITRNGLPLNERFPGIAAALGRVVVGDAIIDGEIAALDARGVPRFERLQQGEGDAVLFAFDLLRLDGEDLRGRPLRERRDLLRSLLSNNAGALRVTEEVAPPFAAALAEVGRRGGEGLVLKLRESRYEHGRSRAWLKLKALLAQELAIVGFLPGEGGAKGGVGALLLAVAEGDGFRFAGKVGTGFTALQRKELQRELEPDLLEAPQLAGAPRLRNARWVRPRLVAQVRFTEWTADGKLRHPSFQGLRADKEPRDCVREKAVPAPAPGSSPGIGPGPSAAVSRGSSSVRSGAGAGEKRVPVEPGLALTHPERLLWPRDGVSKAELASYYQVTSGPLLAALAGRPLSLVHWNDGIDKPGWYQQGLRAAEPWMHVVDTPATGRDRKARTVRHIVADSPAALRWLAQRSALEIHAWHSREGSLGAPDWVVFDLDPASEGGQGVAQAVEVALILHGMFERLGIPSLPKTTGKRGLHVLVPLAPGHTYDDAQAFALRVAETVVAQVKEVTLERSLARRQGRLYLDCLQNAQGKTIVAPYSPRGVDGAPVSAPLRWSEVHEGLDPRAFTVRTMPARLAALGDLFLPALQGGVRLPRLR